VLEQPRRPWLEAEALKQRYLQLSARFHPDRFHSAASEDKTAAARRYAEINTAYQCLSDTRDRVRHLLELERGAPMKDIQRLPAGTFDLFTKIGQACRETDAFLAARPSASSPMLKVQLLRQTMEWTERLAELQREINQRREVVEDRLRAMNAAWESAPPVGDPGRPGALPLDALEDLCRSLSYVNRWAEQIQERLVQLAV